MSPTHRPRIPKDIEEKVIVDSRRRCCICFGLYRDFALKAGQVGHLDHDNTNNVVSNLAFLCFEHHDEYDSTTSQRKNYTLREAKTYRKELHDAVKLDLTKVQDKESPIVGSYLRLNDDGISAQLLVSQLLDGRFHICGVAVAGKHCRHAELEFVGTLNHSEIEYVETEAKRRTPYVARFIFHRQGLSIAESEKKSSTFGAFIGFDGKYKKTGGLGRYSTVHNKI